MMNVEKKVYFDGLTPPVVTALVDGRFPTDDAKAWARYLDATNGGDRVLAVVEYPCIDIELEAWTRGGDEPCNATDNDNDIVLSYFVCIKGLYRGLAGWDSDGFAGLCTVDFSSNRWRDLLEEDMCGRLKEYAARAGYSLTDYNFNI